MSKRFYRCENKYNDPCEFAKNNRGIPEDEVNPSMDGGNPKCPGKTESGADCGQELLPIVGKGTKNGVPKKRWIIALVGGVICAILVLLILLINGDEESNNRPPEHLENPGSESSPNPSENSESKSNPNPWEVYEKLESSSTLLKEQES